MDDNNLIEIKINENNLKHALETWFESMEDEIKLNKNFWSRNMIACLIKQRLKKMNKWKNGSDSQRTARTCDFKKKAKKIQEIIPEDDFPFDF